MYRNMKVSFSTQRLIHSESSVERVNGGQLTDIAAEVIFFFPSSVLVCCKSGLSLNLLVPLPPFP